VARIVTSRVFTGQGRPSLPRAASPRVTFAGNRGLFFPNPIRSDTSCREIAAALDGDSNVGGNRLFRAAPPRFHLGMRHPLLREEGRDPPYPRCLSSMCRTGIPDRGKPLPFYRVMKHAP